MPRSLHVVLVVLVLSTPSRAQQKKDDAEPPAANRVEPFSGAVGRKFTVTTRVDRAELRAGDTLEFTVRVAAEGPWQRPPRRPDLRRHEKYARFPQLFHVENAGERVEPDGQAWEFVYRLRPLDESVTEVPRLPLVYYRPGQGYQTISAPAVRLTVRPRGAVTAAQVEGALGPLPTPERLYQLAEGPDVLRSEPSSVLPGLATVLALVLLPPALCAGWYGVWRWRNPEAIRLTQRRRSRAGQKALLALRPLSDHPPPEQARQAAAVLTEYVRQRFDLSPAEPTPAEVADRLERIGAPAELASAAARLLRACDAARFSPDGGNGAIDFGAEAARLIGELEAASCPS